VFVDAELEGGVMDVVRSRTDLMTKVEEDVNVDVDGTVAEKCATMGMGNVVVVVVVVAEGECREDDIDEDVRKSGRLGTHIVVVVVVVLVEVFGTAALVVVAAVAVGSIAELRHLPFHPNHC
jgi:hypothetical protein